MSQWGGGGLGRVAASWQPASDLLEHQIFFLIQRENLKKGGAPNLDVDLGPTEISHHPPFGPCGHHTTQVHYFRRGRSFFKQSSAPAAGAHLAVRVANNLWEVRTPSVHTHTLATHMARRISVPPTRDFFIHESP